MKSPHFFMVRWNSEIYFLEIQSLRDEVWNFPGFELLVYALGKSVSNKNPTSCPQGTHPPDGSQISHISELNTI
jgi:hypothetical protein